MSDISEGKEEEGDDDGRKHRDVEPKFTERSTQVCQRKKVNEKRQLETK